MAAIDRHRKEISETKEARKQAIVKTAERLFIERGLANVNIQDIVNACEISRVTFYRYFPDIHPLSMEVAARMMGSMYRKILEKHDWLNNPPKETGKKVASVFFTGMVESFHLIEEELVYMGTFDHLYAREYPNEELAKFYRRALLQGLESAGFDQVFAEKLQDRAICNYFDMVGNTILAALERLAARGALLEKEQGTSVDGHLELIKAMLQSLDDNS